MDERRILRNPSPPPGYTAARDPRIILKPEVQRMLDYFPFLKDDDRVLKNAESFKRMNLMIESGVLDDSSDDDFSIIVDGQELGYPRNAPKSLLMPQIMKCMGKLEENDEDEVTYENDTAHDKQQDGDSKLHLEKTAPDPDISAYTSKLAPNITRDHKGEKRQFDKLKSEPDSPEGNEAKIPKLETPQVDTCYPPQGIPDLPKLEQYVSKKDEDAENRDEKADAGDFAMEIGLACVICKKIDVSQENQLIGCKECHSLYHQECHQPAASDYDVNDPRQVWYCAKCVKIMKKMLKKDK